MYEEISSQAPKALGYGEGSETKITLVKGLRGYQQMPVAPSSLMFRDEDIVRSDPVNY